MTSDRELLELAAKAAGVDVKYAPGGNADGSNVLRIVYKRDGYHDWLDREWNPLTDDGDALRLATKLGIDIIVMKNKSMYSEEALCSATRRAITRAAAEIAKGMK